jgi:GT2 family glycosyltransferase
MAAYDIVIANYTTPETEPLALACVKSIRAHSRDYRIIWVQNGPGPSEEIAQELRLAEGLCFIGNDANLGFVRAANQGLRASTAPYVVLLNNDTEAVPGWLEKLREPLVWPIALAGPCTTASGSWQGRMQPGDGTFLLTGDGTLAFFCVMMDRRVLDVVGYLDEDFGLGFGDDDDYCDRVHRAGLGIAFVGGLTIPHRHRSTFRSLFPNSKIEGLLKGAWELALGKKARRIRESSPPGQRIRFSIITPTILRSSLGRLCRSLESQAYRNWEHIVVVDIPETREIPAELCHPQRRWRICERAHGDFGNTCRASAFPMVTGDIVLYADDDNYYLGEALAELRMALGDPLPDWGVFRIDHPAPEGKSRSEWGISDPPRLGSTDMNQIFHKPRIRGFQVEYPAGPYYNADGRMVEWLKTIAPWKIADTGRPLLCIEQHNEGR